MPILALSGIAILSIVIGLSGCTSVRTMFIGIPSPVFPATPAAPTSGLPVPSIDFFKRSEAKAIAKFAATAFDPKMGRLVFATPD